MISRVFVNNSGALFWATWVIFREHAAARRKGEEMFVWLAGTLKSASRKIDVTLCFLAVCLTQQKQV